MWLFSKKSEPKEPKTVSIEAQIKILTDKIQTRNHTLIFSDDRIKSSRLAGLITGGIVGVIIALCTYQPSGFFWLGAVTIGGGLGTGLFSIIAQTYYYYYKRGYFKLKYELIELEGQTLKENLKEDFFDKLVQINFNYIDKYYAQTQVQAQKSFSLAAVAAAIGFLVIATGVVLMFIKDIEAAKITAGAGVLSEFIASIFFYLYNRTILKMSRYHQKLIFTQNVSLALKVSEKLPDTEKIAARKSIIDRITIDINKYLADYND